MIVDCVCCGSGIEKGHLDPDKEKLCSKCYNLKCPECKTRLKFWSAIGHFCPNKKCDRVDYLPELII